MGRLIYALSGQGRGHTSRVMAVSDVLRERGHEIVFCCGGTAWQVLKEQGETVVPVPALCQVLENNRFRLMRTIRKNWRTVLNVQRVTERLSTTFREYNPDLLITDFEAFAPRAADRIGLPVVSFNHQQVVTETNYPLPVRHWPSAALTRAAIAVIAPSRPLHTLISSFFFPPLKDPEHATLVPPIIRRAIQQATPTRGEHVLVYYNQANQADAILKTLRQVDASFIIYNIAPSNPEAYPNLRFKKPSLEGFIRDLTRCRAVLSTAGFTLVSEALYLAKPLLVIPNRGLFEQTLNALMLERKGLGRAILGRAPSADDVRSFLAKAAADTAPPRSKMACGNQAAADSIENLLSSLRPRIPHARRRKKAQPARPYPPSTTHFNE